MPGVKRKLRSYDARGRLERAGKSRQRVIEVARAAFLETGYARTTIAGIAERAGVSVETVYKGFGGKAGLVRAIHDRGLEGSATTPAEKRSDAMSAREKDPRALVAKWGRLMAEVSPLVSPILLLVRAAADAEPELASLLREVDEKRLARMKQNARVLAERGFLRDGVSVAEATEIMWAYTSPELYELLVVRRKWTPAKLGAFAAEAMAASLLRG
jgi:AcrR family transcriptional regulator